MADQDPADLRVATDPSRPLAQPPDHIPRPGHRSARHQQLGDHQHEHPDQQRDRNPEDHEPHRGNERPAPVVLDQRAADRRDDRRGDHQRDQPAEQRPQRRETQTQQPAHGERIHEHGQDDAYDEDRG
jgi:hypothetical protein